MCSGRSGIQHCAGWPPRWTAASKRPGRSSRPSSCCLGHFRKGQRPRNICPSYNTICGWSRPGVRCFRSDPLYQHLIVTAERKFWRCVESGEQPRLFGIEPPKPRLQAVRIPDMTSSNAWAEFATVFTRTRKAHLEHEQAKAELKNLMPEDAKEAIGHGVRAKRSKSGGISFDLSAPEPH